MKDITKGKMNRLYYKKLISNCQNVYTKLKTKQVGTINQYFLFNMTDWHKLITQLQTKATNITSTSCNIITIWNYHNSYFHLFSRSWVEGSKFITKTPSIPSILLPVDREGAS